MEHICENCKNAEEIKEWNEVPCKLGFLDYYECQVSCTKDYFEKKVDEK